MSSLVSLRFNDNEREELTAIASMYGCGLSTLIKKFVYEKLEDEYDLQIAKEYEIQKSEGSLELYSFEEVFKDV